MRDFVMYNLAVHYSTNKIFFAFFVYAKEEEDERKIIYLREFMFYEEVSCVEVGHFPVMNYLFIFRFFFMKK